MRYLIAYDVSEDRVRAAVCEAIDDYGVRVQKSVFECELDGAQLGALRTRLTGILGANVLGGVRIYSLCDRCAGKVEQIGTPPLNPLGDEWVIL